jgi:predicted nucleic acid-binding Zn ribbon protein
MDSKSVIRSIIEGKGGLHFSKGCKKMYKELYDEICENTKFLDETNTRIIDRAYHYINGITEPNKCIECSNPMSRIDSTFCSKKCMDSSEFLKKKKEETSLKKFGSTNVSKTDYFKEKYKNTMNEKYGVDHYSKTKSYLEKYKETSLERYGESNPARSDLIKKKTEDTNIERYGSKSPLQNPVIKQKTIETLTSKYNIDHNSKIEGRYEKMKENSNNNFGTDHPMQNEEVFDKCMKNSYRFKEYKLPSGKIVKVQGYENFALDKLLESYNENDLIIGAKGIKTIIGRIEYFFEGKKKIYHPDIYIVSENKIVEVKSTYTIKVDLGKNEAKRKAVLDKGINFEFMIF